MGEFSLLSCDGYAAIRLVKERILESRAGVCHYSFVRSIRTMFQACRHFKRDRQWRRRRIPALTVQTGLGVGLGVGPQRVL